MKLIRILPIVLLFSFATGVSAFTQAGYVVINADSTQMYGATNVGPNPQTPSEGAWISARHIANSYVMFDGYDKANNRRFSCYVFTNNALYNEAKNIADSTSSTTFLRLNKTATSSSCTAIYMRNTSYNQ